MTKLDKSDMIQALEIAKAAMEHEITSDIVAERVDLSEEEMDRLYTLITTFLEGK